MPNYRPKGTEYMRELGRRGAEKSVKTRQERKAMKILAQYASAHGFDLPAAPVCAKPAKRPNLSGGSHDTDWRCAKKNCRHFNSTKRRLCAKCQSPAPANGRLKRARLRELRAEHRTQAILAKHGLASANTEARAVAPWTASSDLL
jgi:hypothetical protein